MAHRPVATIDRARIAELTAREQERLDADTLGSKAMYERARASLTGGVASSYQLRDPWPIYFERGEGAYVWDVDGTRRIDFHNGFGSMVQGHAHPAITRAVVERLELGSHFAVPTEDAIVVAEELARRWGLPQWRFTNSGSEATMDAIRIARGLTKRDTIVKIFGSYHGHHDGVMVSLGVPYDQIGDRNNYDSIPYGAGVPKAVSRPDDRRPVQRHRRHGVAVRRARARGAQAGLPDHGGRADEPRRRPSRGRLPRGRARADGVPRDRPDLRRGQDRASASPPAARPSGSA